ncbi:MAG: response regulator [Segetibacter sp.]|nr:response regulator [Segetibacter sp.]
MKVVDRRRFFLLDDDNDEGEIYSEIISESKMPIELHCFSKGAQMFDFLQKHRAPDIFILDVNLPGISGIECIRRLKADERYKSVPVVVCTSISNQGKLEESISAGALCYTVKPFDFSGYKTLLEEFYSLCCGKGDYIFRKTG